MITSNFLYPLSMVFLISPGMICAEIIITNPEDAYVRARQLSFDGEYQQAIEIFSQLVTDFPENPDYLLGTGQAYLWNNQPAQAIPWLEKGISISPDYEDLYRTLAQAYKNNGQHQDESLIYKQAITRFGDPDWARDGLDRHGKSANSHFSLRLSNRLESLSKDKNDWRDTNLSFIMKYDSGWQSTVSFVNSERFDLIDNTLAAETYIPVSDNNYIYAELRYSGSHNVLPELSAYLQLNHSFSGGWGLFGGFKRVMYNESDINMIDLGVEYYFSNYRIAYTSIISDSDTAGGTLSHRFQVGYTFDSLSNIQIALATGSEVEKPINASSIIKTDFTNISLWGEIVLNNSWTFVYAAGYTDLTVNDINNSNRKSINLGIQYNF